MNWTMFKASLELRRASLVWYAIGLTAYGWMMVAFYPIIETNIDYQAMIEQVFTPEMMAAFGGAGIEFSTLGGFMAIEYLTLIWVFIIAAAVITFIAGALGGAVEDGTMEVTLSQPVSRSTVALTSYLGMATYSAILSFVTVATIYLPGFLHDVDVPLDAMALLFVVGTLMSLAIGGLAFFISAVSSGKGRTIGITLGVLVAMYLADVLGNLSDKAEWLVDFSLFNYWEPNRIVDDLEVAAATWIVFGIAALVFFVAGMIAFQKRDVV